MAWHPQAIESNNNKIRDADSVLRAIHELSKALFQDDKNLIANTSITVGLAVSCAHAEPYEKLAITGDKSTEGYKNRDDQIKKSNFQEWIKDYPEKIAHCKTIKDLREIDRIKAIPVTDPILRDLKEISLPTKRNNGYIPFW